MERKEKKQFEIERTKLERLLLDACYSRKLCKMAGVNYNRMDSEEVNKLRNYIIDRYNIKVVEVKK